MDALNTFVVEDNSIERQGIIIMLEELGHRVTGHAGGGEEAIAKLTALDGGPGALPDILLMDIHLPKMNGLELAEELGQRWSFPIVLVTGYQAAGAVPGPKPRNIYGYLQKPVNSRSLKETIDIAVSRAKEAKSRDKELAQIRLALEDRKLVERAKGIIMKMNQCTEEEAMRNLQKRSRNSNQRISEVAKEIIAISERLKI